MGAWIETSESGYAVLPILVAPYVGAWIETWGQYDELQHNYVAPYVGAWIETSSCLTIPGSVLSHPTWVRGLKHVRHHHHVSHKKSHPTWVRGLKHVVGIVRCYSNVAPYVGAWIETD